MSLIRSLAIVTALLATVVHVSAQQPITQTDMPPRWQYAPGFDQTLPADDNWWQMFGDTTLDSLIVLGADNNYDVLQAMRRIEIARQTLRQTRSDYFPSLSVGAGWNKSRVSGMTGDIPTDAATSSRFSLSLDMNWEIDVFGRITTAAKGKKAAYRASRAEYAATSVSICARIATAYMQLRTLQAQKAVLMQHIASQQHVDSLTVARFEAGLASKLDVAQARTTLYSTRASMTAIETSITTTINALAVLTGMFPQQIAPWLMKEAPMPDYHQLVTVGVPMELLRRRPDVVSAEYSLAEATAAAGVAKKDFLPTLSIAGSIGTAAHNAGDLFSHQSLTYTIAPTLSWTIFDGFSRSAASAIAREQMHAAIDNYNLTILTAVQEVDNAMATYANDLRYIDLMTRTVQEATESYNLSINLYKNDLASFINVSNAQINLLQYANELVLARGQALAALINLYQALGGGWEGITE